MNETTTHPKASELADELEPFIAAALEPKPAPLPEQDSRVGEAMAGRADIQAYALWRERTDEARRQLAERGPDILTALRTPPTATEETVESVADWQALFNATQKAAQALLDKCDHECTMFGSYGEMEIPPVWEDRYQQAKRILAALSTYPVTRADEKGVADELNRAADRLSRSTLASNPMIRDVIRSLRTGRDALCTPAPDSREAVLEEAARECERLADEGDAYERKCAGGRSWFNIGGDHQRAAAVAIRALKSTPSKTTADQVGEANDG